MKKLTASLALFAAFAFCAFADSLTLGRGLNTVGTCGRIAAIEAVTVSADQSLKIQSIRTVTDATNAYRTVVVKRPRFDFTLTNWYGVASVSTNVWDRYDPLAWMPGGTNHLVGAVSETWIPFTNSVVVGVLPGVSYTVTNDVWSASASGHYKLAQPTNAFITGGSYLVTCGPNDTVTVILE